MSKEKIDPRTQTPSQTIEPRLLHLASSVEEASYSLNMTPAMRMSYMEKKLDLEKQIRIKEEELKQYVSARKLELKEMYTRELRMSQEIGEGKLQVEGKQFTIMYQEMGKAGVYDEKGNLISWRYMAMNEYQMNVAIEAERVDIQEEAAHVEEVHAEEVGFDHVNVDSGFDISDLNM